MDTPILDFLRAYAVSGTSRLHIPAHKGRGELGCEAMDITEISGADDLAQPSGILLESERSSAGIFGAGQTCYLTGGSSQGIKAMLHLAALQRRGAILAGRNAHKAFFHACALLDLPVRWLYGENLCSCRVTPASLEEAIAASPEPLAAVYVTSPDYLGNVLDIASLAELAHRYSLPLLVDNAHGSYLTIYGRHQIALGADLCCDSAHKTLTALTGGAYLHMKTPDPRAREAISIYGTSSPSYLILASLDGCNRALREFSAQSAGAFAARLADLAAALPFPNRSEEPWKITLDCAAIGASGSEVAQRLRHFSAEPEFADEDFVVLMLSPRNTEEDLQRILSALGDYPVRPPRAPLLAPVPGEQVLSLREAMLAPRENVAVSRAAGRICASAAISCPPAIPLAVPGERISPEAAAQMAARGIAEIGVISSQ